MQYHHISAAPFHVPWEQGSERRTLKAAPLAHGGYRDAFMFQPLRQHPPGTDQRLHIAPLLLEMTKKSDMAFHPPVNGWVVVFIYVDDFQGVSGDYSYNVEPLETVRTEPGMFPEKRQPPPGAADFVRGILLRLRPALFRRHMPHHTNSGNETRMTSARVCRPVPLRIFILSQHPFPGQNRTSGNNRLRTSFRNDKRLRASWWSPSARNG
ncbi:MAG: hypothetical protein BWY09_02230 [Candidatus Hydrogenedentes bacterium ADurb.Bin179]|nr:MAG: hypothetical protein BWY09_02230 [Candidatus Hydrogenedentes bacterium ADurb.Bin179]